MTGGQPLVRKPGPDPAAAQVERIIRQLTPIDSRQASLKGLLAHSDRRLHTGGEDSTDIVNATPWLSDAEDSNSETSGEQLGAEYARSPVMLPDCLGNEVPSRRNRRLHRISREVRPNSGLKVFAKC